MLSPYRFFLAESILFDLTEGFSPAFVLPGSQILAGHQKNPPLGWVLDHCSGRDQELVFAVFLFFRFLFGLFIALSAEVNAFA